MLMLMQGYIYMPGSKSQGCLDHLQGKTHAVQFLARSGLHFRQNQSISSTVIASCLQADFEVSPGSVAVPKLRAKGCSASVSLPGRYTHARPAISRQWTTASGAYIDVLPISGEPGRRTAALPRQHPRMFILNLWPAISCQWTIASAAYIDALPISGAHVTIIGHWSPCQSVSDIAAMQHWHCMSRLG